MLTNEEQKTMLQIKSLLNHIRYFLRDDTLPIVDEYHQLCRKYCSMKVTKLPSVAKKPDIIRLGESVSEYDNLNEGDR